MSDWPPDGKKVCPTCHGDTLVADASTAQHEREYWLTVDREGGGLRLWKHYEFSTSCRKPSNASGRWNGMPANIECPEAFRPLADPTKPVRIRLKMTAERAE